MRNPIALRSNGSGTAIGIGIAAGRGGVAQPLATNLSGFKAQPRPRSPHQHWYRSIDTAIGGDGQVPIESLVSTLPGDPDITLDPLAGINHLTVLTNPTVQAMSFTLLQDSVPPPP